MAKVLLVEDDNNLREIFEMRLQAEGYETSTASDGEEALAVAIKEKPDLIISDAMMPKMSGFDMVENLRNSPDLAKTKVIMMTALGQAEDQGRGQKLGVLKYLVKSQVTLEDFVRTVKEVVGGPSNAANNNQGGNMQNDSQGTNPAPAGGDMPASGDAGAGANPVSGAADGQMSSAQAQDSMNNQVNDAMGGAATPAAPAADAGAPAPANPAPAGDMTATPGDVPMSTPPAAPAGGDAGADGGDGGNAQPPADGQGTGTPPAAPGGM